MKPLGDEMRVVSRARQIPAPAPRSALADAATPRVFWSGDGEQTVIGSGAAATLTAAGENRFADVREAADRLFTQGDVHAGTEAARPRLFGGFAFHDEHDMGEGPWGAFPSAQFVLPRRQVTYTDDAAWLTVNGVGPGSTAEAVSDEVDTTAAKLANLPDSEPRRSPSVVERERTTTKAAWRASVTDATDRIAAGELRKVVLAMALCARLDGPLAAHEVTARLADTYPDCYRFLFEPTGDTDPTPAFIGATPERLATLRGRTLATGALAGTTGRGDTPTEDEWLADELRRDEKNIHEHEIVVDAIRNQLSPVAASISTGKRDVRRLATVQHLETPITATLADDEHVLTLVEALHPTPAVGGLPPDRALATIRDTESFDRGWYAAPVGWFDAAGHGSFAVAIRSAVTAGDTATLFAGVGIVEDSDPDAEWDEVQLKYRPMLDELE
ncbi:MAG: isochorismate synthase [Halobacteriales archaeon]|nr:isochorismate synthase [Halobacteriales archaeon]